MKIYIILSSHFDMKGIIDRRCVFRGAFKIKKKAQQQLKEFEKYNLSEYTKFDIIETTLQ